MEPRPLFTIVETPTYRRQASRWLTASERSLLVQLMAASPSAGDRVAQIDCLRRIRWPSTRHGPVSVIVCLKGPARLLFLLSVLSRHDEIVFTNAEMGELLGLASLATDELEESEAVYEQTG